MARIPLGNTSYTQLNTDPVTYITQNLTQGLVGIIVSDTQPANDADHEFELSHLDGISNDEIVGILWGIALNRDEAFMGLKEG